MGKTIYLSETTHEEVVHEVGNFYTDNNDNYYLLAIIGGGIALIDIDSGTAWSDSTHIRGDELKLSLGQWNTVSGDVDFDLIKNNTLCIGL